MHPTEGRPLTARLAAIILAVALLAAAIVLPASPAHAASQGAGFFAFAALTSVPLCRVIAAPQLTSNPPGG